ncbi:MAG: GYDIA family GHMP kinase [Flavobacteriaceae bacterium]
MKNFTSNGKLLITSEYVVLDGALSLAIPTKLGQSLKIEPINEPKIIWSSLDEKDAIWFKDEFQIEQLISSQAPHDDVSNRLIQILNATKQLNPNFLKNSTGFKLTTKLDFPKNWGLGTSSTLINNIAQWANVDPYRLLKNTFGGSGYDVACARNDTPITYQLQNEKPIIKSVDFNPLFKNHLYFVHLNKKQNSRDGIKHYNETKGRSLNTTISNINDITLKIIDCKNLSDFENLLNQHETIISKVTKQTPVKELLFNDFKGSIKSLGAWGGDFVLTTSKENPSNYFKNKGFNTIIPYSDMVL